MGRLLFIAPLVVFLLLGAYFAIGLTRDPSHIPSALIDKPLPAFDLPAIEGYDRGLSSNDLGGKIALINFFGSWCVSCVIEHPVLMEIAAKEDVLLVGIDWKDKPGDGARWLERRGDPYALIGDDADGRTALDFGITGAPETFIIDRNGRIRYRYQGPITEDVWRDIINPLLGQLKRDGGGDA